MFGYVEPRCNVTKDIQLYAGLWGWSTKLPTTPTGEFDVYGGIRLTFGQFAFDFGGMYYWYPNETQLFFADPAVTTLSPTNFGFRPVHGRRTPTSGKSTASSPGRRSIGWRSAPTSTTRRTGCRPAPNATYAGSTVKVTMPSKWFPADWGAYVSGEAAHYWIGTFTAFGRAVFTCPTTPTGTSVPRTYKVFTFDLRYHDTDLPKRTASCSPAIRAAS